MNRPNRRNRNRGNRRRRQDSSRAPKREPIKYGVVFFDTFREARENLDKLKTEAADVGQLNVVVREEGNMDDEELLSVEKTKVFAGTAWASIHDRRLEEGWYEEMH